MVTVKSKDPGFVRKEAKGMQQGWMKLKTYETIGIR